MDFNKPSISKKIEKFLLDNLKTEKEKESLINVTTGKSVLKGDAIALLITIVQAMTIVDEETKEEFDAIIPEDDGENDKDNGGADEFPTLAQSMVKWSSVESKGKKLASAHVSPIDPVSSNPRSSVVLTGDELLHKFENVCYFYKLGKCRFGKECKKEHPKFCQKFINNGPSKSNPKGCDSKCNNLHPIACRDSIKSRECARDKCRFYHLKGTKKPDTLSSPQVHSQSAPLTQGTSQPQIHSVQNAMPMQNQNLTQSSPNVRFNSTPQQVFQVDQTAILTTLQLMMEEMRSWR